jgi:hypothetical protein
MNSLEVEAVALGGQMLALQKAARSSRHKAASSGAA